MIPVPATITARQMTMSTSSHSFARFAVLLQPAQFADNQSLDTGHDCGLVCHHGAGDGLEAAD